jgi:ribose/xylose/arabinose/galactoside ABC-type transport system permease subunit
MSALSQRVSLDLDGVRRAAARAFLAVGLVPVLLVVMIVVFAVIEPRFISTFNILNIGRQSTYLVVATMGQMLYLLTRHFDLSNGACVALTSVISAKVMTSAGLVHHQALAIALGCLAGLGVGLTVGFVNGWIIAKFNITSFMATLASASVLTGLALLITNGIPVQGLPTGYVSWLGSGKIAGIPVSIFFAVGLAILFYVLLSWTRLGRNAYAIGGNIRAAHVSGVRVARETILLLMIGSMLAAVSGLMLTARLASGEANTGADLSLQTIAAAALGGVSLFGGEGRLSGALIGAVFIVVLSNGMDLTQVSSYIQLIVLGVLLVVALLVDRARGRLSKTYA